VFKLKPEVDDWFKHVLRDGPIKTKFDLYYFCLMAGLAKGVTENVQGVPDFVSGFVLDFKQSRRLIITTFIVAEMFRLGLELNDRKEIQDLMSRYIDSSNEANLTTAGFEKMNEYANAGFNVILENHGEPPHPVEPFLQWYAKFIKASFADSVQWGAISGLPI
jgi:hypothetical protein